MNATTGTPRPQPMRERLMGLEAELKRGLKERDNWRTSYNKTLAELTEARNANHAVQDRIMVALNTQLTDDDEEEEVDSPSPRFTD